MKFKTFEEIERYIAGLDLGEFSRCPVCRNMYTIPCPEHMAKTDEDGWCLMCDTSGNEPGPVNCPCNE